MKINNKGWGKPIKNPKTSNQSNNTLNSTINWRNIQEVYLERITKALYKTEVK